MKKTIAFLFVVIILFIIMFAANTSASQQIFLVFGDSIAAGLQGTNNNSSLSYAGIVSKNFNFKLINTAMDGTTSDGLLNFIKSDAVKADIKKADVINISIGGNDFLKLLQQFSSQFQQSAPQPGEIDISAIQKAADKVIDDLKINFLSIIREIKNINIKAVIYCQNIYLPDIDTDNVDTTQYSAMINDFFTRLNAVFSDYLKANPNAYVLLDLKTAFNGNSDYISSDMIHPSLKGHEKIAQMITDSLYSKGFKPFSDNTQATLKTTSTHNNMNTSTIITTTTETINTEAKITTGTTTAIEIQKGDLNRDGKIDYEDLFILRNHLLSNPFIEDPRILILCDINNDEIINGLDYLLLKMIINGMEDDFFGN